MDIIVKGRRTEISDRFRDHVETKLAKLSKWEKKGMEIDVEVSRERNPRQAAQSERIELTIHSTGPVIRSEASADDRYGALDLAVERIEARLRKAADRRKVSKSGRTPVSVADATAALAAEAAPAAAVPSPASGSGAAGTVDGDASAAGQSRFDDDIVELDTQGDGPVVVREKFHSAKPMSIDQALMEMELVGHDFYLFHDEDANAPSVVYRRKGFNYGVMRLVD
ncbi:ribosome hibernation-promoting factor, HPF/YfiA family [Nocardiopsis coralliicola]